MYNNIKNISQLFYYLYENIFKPYFKEYDNDIKCIDSNLLINYKELYSDYQCPICISIPLFPVKCSKTNIIMCKECREKSNTCPFHCQNCEIIDLSKNEKNIIEKFNF